MPFTRMGKMIVNTMLPNDLLNKIQDGIVVFDTSRNILFINDRMKEFAGITNNSLTGKPIIQLLKRSSNVTEINKFLLEMDGHEPVNSLKCAGNFKNGVQGFFEFRLSFPSKEEGKYYLVCTLLEESPHQLFEKTSLFGLFSSIFDNTINPIFIKDTTGKYLAVNDACLAGMNLTRAEVIGRTAHILFPNELVDKINKLDKEVIEEGKVVKYEAERMMNGERRQFIVTKTPLKDKQGKIYGLLGISEEQTDKVKSQSEFKSVNRQLRQLIGNIKGMVYRCQNDSNWTMTYCSEGTLQLTGYMPQELTKNAVLSFNDLILEEDRDKVWMEVQEALKSKSQFQLDYRIKTKSGNIEWVWERGSGVYDEEGNLVFLEGLIVNNTKAKQNEEKNRFYSQISQQLNEAIISTDLSGIVDSWNKSAKRIFGFTTKEVIGRHISMVFPEEIRPELREKIFLPVVNSGKFSGQFTFQKKNGRPFTGQLSLNLLHDEDKIPTGVAGVVLDISHEKKIESKLKTSEQQYRLLVEAANEGIWELDEHGNTVFVNKKMADMLGYSRRAMLGKQVLSFVHSEYLPIVKYHMSIRRKGTSSRYESRFLRKDGSSIWVSVSASPLMKDGKFEGSLGLVTDITRQKKAEIAQNESHQNLMALSKATTEGVVFHENGIVLNANQVFCEMVGYPRKEVVGAHISKFTTSDYFSTVMKHMKSGKASNYEIQGLKKDGSMVSGQVIARNTVYMGKKARVVVIRDLTEIKESERIIKELNQNLEQKVKERTAQLEAANLELESFSYSVSHDLRAPLRAITGFAHILGKEYKQHLPVEGWDILDFILKNTDKMGNLINDLLEFSRINKFELRKVETDMNRLLSIVLSEFEHEIKERKVEISVNHLPPALCDPHLIQIVLQNIIANALKFTRKKKQAVIEFGFNKEAKPPCYFVKDNGAGFNMKQQHKLFYVFQRLHAESDFEGTGIGLAISKRIIKRHGGQIWIKGKVNGGAEIFFTLPNSLGL